MSPHAPQADAQRLIDRLAGEPSVLVAFSGGVDSSVVAAAAHRALGPRAVAVTAHSPSVSQHQLEIARQVATEIGIAHRVVSTAELQQPEYVANDGRRCFWCKQTLYATLAPLAKRLGMQVIASGTNADDLDDYRPGIEAGRAAEVCTPLADLGLDKASVRAVAQHWGLSNWDLPAAPCLSSRVAYGTPVTAELLQRIERAEAWLRDRGLVDLRVRAHPGDLARIEVPAEDLAALAAQPLRGEIVAAMEEFGFRFVTLDLSPLRSGNLNQLIQIAFPSSPPSCSAR